MLRCAGWWLWAGAVAAGAVGGCGADADACVELCARTCTALETCDIDAGPSCHDDCLEGFEHFDCGRFRLMDDVTCADYGQAFECAAHCGAVCERASACDVGDQDACEIGCALDTPGICNEASAAARECSQIEAEARAYIRRGREFERGDPPSFSPVPQGNPTGLCSTADACQLPKGCMPATNTCGPCQDHDECARRLGAHVCDEGGACVEVACNDDDDCLASFCDTDAHVCRRCLEDAHCDSNICNSMSYICGECRSDDDCSNLNAAHCDVDTSECVACTQDAHCPDESLAASSANVRCSVSANRCVECLEDADCAPPSPRCQASRCTQCASNDDCTDPARPTCIPSAWVCGSP